ncbi:hypothetical protein C1H46_001404 [Malus baccata]|uniref:Uncharacterized protein n=1 Tax=Malus baccata TaxID=106549 RepID=A0A540NPT3_MALBA|nr:hypothetical protein C1H46_001404 [Malus baccata]
MASLPVKPNQLCNCSTVVQKINSCVCGRASTARSLAYNREPRISNSSSSRFESRRTQDQVALSLLSALSTLVVVRSPPSSAGSSPVDKDRELGRVAHHCGPLLGGAFQHRGTPSFG